MSDKINNFDVIKEMSERGMESIKMAPLDNIIGAQKKKYGWVIEIGCAFDLMPGILNNQFVGGLILADKTDFNRVKAEMETAPNSLCELLDSAEMALRTLYEETADYIRTNHLGDVHHNVSMQKARDVLARICTSKTVRP